VLLFAALKPRLGEPLGDDDVEVPVHVDAASAR
jgi:hypothetical protein